MQVPNLNKILKSDNVKDLQRKIADADVGISRTRTLQVKKAIRA
jgi:hypothetical protein